MVDPTVAFLAGISIGQILSLLVVTGSIKIGEARALKEMLQDLIWTLSIKLHSRVRTQSVSALPVVVW